MHVATYVLLFILAILLSLFAVAYIAALMDMDDLKTPTPPMPTRNYRVLILGYHERLAGGVVSATRTLLDLMPEARLLPIKHCYGARGWVLYVMSLGILIHALLMTTRPFVAHLIVASRGDRIRGVPPILLCKVFRVPICAHYHTNRANMSLCGVDPILARI